MYTNRLSTVQLIIGAGCLCLQLFVQPVSAEDVSVKAPLDPQKITQVREVGHALLQANRHYKATTDAQQIYQQVEQVRTAIETLTQPLAGSISTVTGNSVLQSSSLQPTPGISSPSVEVWKQARGNQIHQLNNKLSTLRQQSNDYRAKYEMATLGLFQRFSAWVSGSETSSEATNNLLITDVSKQVLDRLEHLDEEVNAAINGAPDERHQKLVRLAKSLEITQQPVGLPEDKRDETPTYITRTTHR